MMPYDAMCITSWVWCARHAGHNRSHVIFQSGPVSCDPSAHEPKLMSSSRWFFLGHQAANGDPFIMFASFLCSQEPTRDGSQSTRKPSCFDEWNQLSLGCHHLWWQWEKTLDVAAGCSWMQVVCLFSGIGLQSRRHGRALFDTEPLGKPTCHTSLWFMVVP